MRKNATKNNIHDCFVQIFTETIQESGTKVELSVVLEEVNSWCSWLLSLQDTHLKLSARVKLWRLFLRRTEEVLCWFVSRMRHKPPHAYTAVYHRVPTIWSVLKGSLLKYSLSIGSYPDALIPFLPFYLCTRTSLMHLNSTKSWLSSLLFIGRESVSFSPPTFNSEWSYCQDWHNPRHGPYDV